MQRPQTSVATPQSKFDRFYRGLKNESGEFYIPSGSTRPGTPSQNVLARPPSASLAGFNQTGIGISRLSTISSNGSTGGARNLGISMPGQMNINAFERPITQHGVAGIRPATARGLSMTRQIQDKRYYIGLMQLKIRELNQEMNIIMKDIEEQNKERATYAHYDKRAKDLATELTGLQGKLADYNIVVDKMTSDIGKEYIEEEIEELAAKNEQSLVKIENMFEERKRLEQKLNKMEKQLEDERKRTERLIENMDSDTKKEYEELLKEKIKLQEKASEMQQELDKLYKEQLYLEEEITLSPLKQEAVKLHLKIIETEEKRDKLREEESHRISPEEEKENLLQKIRQDNMDIAAAEAQLAKQKKRMQETEENLEQLEADLEDTRSEKQIKYKELRKREEMIEEFMASFDDNKQDETKKLYKLENVVVKYLENISSVLNVDIDFTGNDEMALLNSLPLFNNEYTNGDASFDRLAKENLKLQQILSEMEILEEKLKTEFTDLNEKMYNKENELITSDLDSIKIKLAATQTQLIAECQQLKEKELRQEEEFNAIESKYNEMRQRLERYDAYAQINMLENTMEKLMQEHKNIENFIVKERERANYGTIKSETFHLINSYNSMLKESLKQPVY